MGCGFSLLWVGIANLAVGVFLGITFASALFTSIALWWRKRVAAMVADALLRTARERVGLGDSIEAALHEARRRFLDDAAAERAAVAKARAEHERRGQ